MLKAASVAKWHGHYRSVKGLGRLADAYCDIGYYYDPSVDNCVPMPENSSVCDIGYTWSDVYQTCMPTGNTCPPGQFQNMDGTCTSLITDPSTIPTQTISTDGGNSQLWAQIIAAAGKITTSVLQATSTMYQTPYGTYRYGTGPYSALTPALAQQYLDSRSLFGGMSTNTMLLIGGGLLLVLMMMKR